MPAVTLRCLRPTDPVHDPARLEVDDHQAATRTEGAKDVSVDRRRVCQVMVDDPTEERIAATFGEVRARDRALITVTFESPVAVAARRMSASRLSSSSVAYT